MSSVNSQNQVTEASAIAQELVSAVNSGKAILPFSETRLPYSWQPASQQIAFFGLDGYEAIEEYNPLDQVITVQCGIKLHALEKFLLANKQWLPVASYNKQTSLLDLILTGNAGPTEIFSGGLRRHLLGLTFLLSNGCLAKSGGKVVKNVSGYDLTRFFIGSYGHFALPISANLRLYSLPEQTCTIFVASKDIEPLLRVAKSIFDHRISISYLDILDKRLLSEDFIDLISKRTILTDVQNYCLLAKIQGDESTAVAETSLAKNVIDEIGLECISFIEDSEQEQSLNSLSNIDGCLSINTKYRNVLEIAMSNGVFRKICKSKDFNSFPFLYRPGSGRLLYCLNSYTTQDSLLALFNEYAKKENEPMTVAYSNHSYMKKVNILGDIANGAKAIKTVENLLKKQFDPNNLFNPFVDL